MFGSECAANVLQFATRAVTPHQREVQYDYPAVSFSLPSLLILATAILETNGAARLPVRQDPMRVDLEAMAITFTRLDQKSRVSSSITISRSWKPDTAIVPDTQSPSYRYHARQACPRRRRGSSERSGNGAR